MPSFVMAEEDGITNQDDEQNTEDGEGSPNPDPNPGPSPDPDPSPEPPPVPEEKPDSSPEEEPTEKPEGGESAGGDKDEEAEIEPPKKPAQPWQPAPPNYNTDRPSVPKNSTQGSSTTRPNHSVSTPISRPERNAPVDESVPASINDEEALPEEVEVEEIEEEEEAPEIAFAEFSLEELMEMMKDGEVTGEVKDDQYYVILKETKEKREITKEEALELGIIEEEEPEEPEEPEELIEKIEEPKQEVLNSEKSKMPLYVSAAGGGIILMGSLLYLFQLRRTRK